MTKPPLLIDVDGPLNPYAARPERSPEGYETHRTSPTGRTGAKPLRVWLDPDHGSEPLALGEAYELVWATTWRGEASEWTGPPPGPPEPPFADWPQMHGKAPRGTFRKTRYILEYAAGRPFAWIDDDTTSYDHEYGERNHPAAALLLRVDERIGPVRTDFDALAEWAAAL
ncbi:hypothetical protein ACFY84_21860 [Streptomyces sp. NPDC012438]|uniref:hypothetical protein n=1 Tax=Streptomyces sp. NPDC012438 TaxID=3364833 RepID=UPI0036EE61C2